MMIVHINKSGSIGEGGRVFNVVSGSITDGVHTAANEDSQVHGRIIFILI